MVVKLTVIPLGLGRTVESNPAFSHVDVPLASTFSSSNAGKESYVVVEGDRYRFTVRRGADTRSEERHQTVGVQGFCCLVSGASIEPKHIYAEASPSVWARASWPWSRSCGWPPGGAASEMKP
jgi:putative DNA methylase